MFGSRVCQSALIFFEFFDDRVDVTGKRQRHDIGVEPVDHRSGLLARTAMRLLDGHSLAGLGLPLGGEGGVELLVELAGRVIGDVEDGRVGECESEDSELNGAGKKAGKKTFGKAGWSSVCLRLMLTITLVKL